MPEGSSRPIKKRSHLTPDVDQRRQVPVAVKHHIRLGDNVADFSGIGAVGSRHGVLAVRECRVRGADEGCARRAHEEVLSRWAQGQVIAIVQSAHLAHSRSPVGFQEGGGGGGHLRIVPGAVDGLNPIREPRALSVRCSPKSRCTQHMNHVRVRTILKNARHKYAPLGSACRQGEEHKQIIPSLLGARTRLTPLGGVAVVHRVPTVPVLAAAQSSGAQLGDCATLAVRHVATVPGGCRADGHRGRLGAGGGRGGRTGG